MIFVIGYEGIVVVIVDLLGLFIDYGIVIFWLVVLGFVW